MGSASHYLNQYSVIVNWTIRNKLQWFFLIKCKTFHSSAKWRPFCPGEDELSHDWVITSYRKQRMWLFIHVLMSIIFVDEKGPLSGNVVALLWRLKSPASRLFAQSFIQTQIKEYIKSPRHWPLCVVPAQMASNSEDVSILWRHHVVLVI